MGPAALRHPAGPLPADPADDATLPAELQALKQEAERRLRRVGVDGRSLVSSSLYDAGAWFSTGLGDQHSHDAQIAFIPSGLQRRTCGIRRLNVDTAQYFDDASRRLAADAESIMVLANPVLPHSEGEIVLESADPTAQPAIRMNYFGDPHDMKVMRRGAAPRVGHRRALAVARQDRPADGPAVPGREARLPARARRRATRSSRIWRCISR